MLTTTVTREMSGRSWTEKVFGLCGWTNGSSFLRLDEHHLGIAPAYPFGAPLVFRQPVFSIAMSYAGMAIPKYMFGGLGVYYRCMTST